MRLSRSASDLLDLLCWYGKKFRLIYPTQQRLADHLNLKIRQIRRLVRELRDAGLMVVERAGRKAAEYLLDLAKINQLVAEQNVLSKSYLSPVGDRLVTGQKASVPYISSVASSVSINTFFRRKPPQRSEHPAWVLEDEGMRAFYGLPPLATSGAK